MGIIPAHAGNTDDVGLGDFDLKDHPRACGEHQSALSAQPDHEGSSPRMRGTLKEYIKHGHEFRIIPAHAGNTN